MEAGFGAVGFGADDVGGAGVFAAVGGPSAGGVSGSAICTIDPHRGQATIVPTSASSVTFKRQWQLTQRTEKGTVKCYLPPASAIMLETSEETSEAVNA